MQAETWADRSNHVLLCELYPKPQTTVSRENPLAYEL